MPGPECKRTGEGEKNEIFLQLVSINCVMKADGGHVSRHRDHSGFASVIMNYANCSYEGLIAHLREKSFKSQCNK